VCYNEGCLVCFVYLALRYQQFVLSQVVSVLIEFSKSLGMKILTVATDSYIKEGVGLTDSYFLYHRMLLKDSV